MENTNINNITSQSSYSLGDNFNPEAEFVPTEANTPAPPPDGAYLVAIELRPKFGQTDLWKPTEFDGENYFTTSMMGKIIGGEYEGRTVFLNSLTTRLNAQGTNLACAFIKAVGGFDDELQDLTAHEELKNLVVKAANIGRPVTVQTKWSARKFDKETGTNEFWYTGMDKFPVGENGQPAHVIEGVKAIAQIVNFLPMSYGVTT